MTYNTIGRVEKYRSFMMHNDLILIYKEVFKNDPSPIYREILLQWEGKILEIKSYSNRIEDKIYKCNGFQTWNLYPEYIKEIITKEDNPEYFL